MLFSDHFQLCGYGAVKWIRQSKRGAKELTMSMKDYSSNGPWNLKFNMYKLNTSLTIFSQTFPVLVNGSIIIHPCSVWKLRDELESSLSVTVSSVTHSCVTLCDPWTAHQASLSITSSRSLLELMSIESVMPSNHLILCHPLLLQPSVFPSIRVFSNESVLRIRWPKYWSFSISPSKEYPGLISFKMDWLDLFAVQGILKSLLQQYSSKASIFGAQPSS